ncbi:MAG: hypothetical protein FWD31_08985 [Planctomycetaceae bacterium]|nr:hypothetical protein [Planctomycetaceae bacterium]
MAKIDVASKVLLGILENDLCISLIELIFRLKPDAHKTNNSIGNILSDFFVTHLA